MDRPNQQSAFSLVELSIVLVILGLLTGGILAGQSLIRAAEIRSYVSDNQRYIAAVAAFRDKYFAMPGDMANATRFWGALPGVNNATCQNTEATSSATCDGNGDGIVWTSNLSGVSDDERFRFWQHLGNAGLIEGTYTGRTDSATSGSFVLRAGKNVPALKGNSTYTIVYALDNLGSLFVMPGNIPGHYLEFRDRSSNGSLLPEEQWAIDTKLDDGRPGYGTVLGPKNSWITPPCTTTDVAATSEYILTSKNKSCRFNIRI